MTCGHCIYGSCESCLHGLVVRFAVKRDAVGRESRRERPSSMCKKAVNMRRIDGFLARFLP